VVGSLRAMPHASCALDECSQLQRAPHPRMPLKMSTAEMTPASFAVYFCSRSSCSMSVSSAVIAPTESEKMLQSVMKPKFFINVLKSRPRFAPRT
jgi:hypothetical protein